MLNNPRTPAIKQKNPPALKILTDPINWPMTSSKMKIQTTNINKKTGHVDFQVQAQRQKVNIAHGRKNKAILLSYSAVVGYDADTPPTSINRKAYEDQKPPKRRKVQQAHVFPTIKHIIPTIRSTRPLVVKKAPIKTLETVTPPVC